MFETHHIFIAVGWLTIGCFFGFMAAAIIGAARSETQTDPAVCSWCHKVIDSDGNPIPTAPGACKVCREWVQYRAQRDSERLQGREDGTKTAPEVDPLTPSGADFHARVRRNQ